MGKIRVKVLGDEEAEKKQKEEAKKRAEAKRLAEDKSVKPVKAEETVDAAGKEAPKEEKKVKSKYAAKNTKVRHSEKYQTVAQQVDKSKTYSLSEALALLPQLKVASFDETVELHINTTDKGISGSVTLPHGTGKQVRIAIANQSEDPKAVEELVKKVEGGTIDFDILLATPDAMPKLAKIARVLGPKGLMPNPKNGTVTAKPEEAAKKYQGGQVNFKTEAKSPILHMSVGKVSFGEKKLQENILSAFEAVQAKNIKNITLKSTMSPGIKVAIA
jgi:large subunit ribosomal protein L1